MQKTAIKTKQNIKDGAFIDGIGTDKDSSFYSIHVYEDTIIDGQIHNKQFNNAFNDMWNEVGLQNQRICDLENKTEFDIIHITGDATIDKALIVDDITLNSTVGKQSKFLSSNLQMINETSSKCIFIFKKLFHYQWVNM